MASMGTRMDLVFPGMDDITCSQVMGPVRQELSRIEAKLSMYQSDSDVSLINDTAHTGSIEMDDELTDIFRKIVMYHEETEGYFDVTLKPVYDYYRDAEEKEAALPNEIRRIVGMENVVIDERGISFLEKGVQIDLGGFGKGYAMKRVVGILHSFGVERALISFGESLVCGMGSHPYGETWRVSVPVEGSSNQLTFDLKDETLSTSGNTLNNQKKFANSAHIINPVSLKMRRGMELVSVKSEDPLRSEVFSTAFFSAGEERSTEILQKTTDLEMRWTRLGIT